MTLQRHLQRPDLGAQIDLYEMDASAFGGPTYRWTPGAFPTGYYANRCLNPSGEGGASGTAAGWVQSAGWDNFSATQVIAGGAFVGWFAAGWTGTPAKALRYEGSPAAVIPCVASEEIVVQAEFVTYRIGAELRIEWRNSGGGIISDVLVASLGETYWSGYAVGDGALESDYQVISGSATAPSGTAGYYAYVAPAHLGASTTANFCQIRFRKFLTRPIMPGEKLPTQYVRPSASGLVLFGGVQYTPLPIRCEGFDRTARGAQPRPKLYVPNVERTATALAIAYGDLLGAKITRRRTFEAFLDRKETSDPDAYQIEVYYIDRKAKQDPDWVTWELATILDVEGRMFPRRQVIKLVCSLIYRDQWNGSTFTYHSCQYTGSNYFTAAGAATTAGNDVCGKRLSDCALRFGANAELPFGGFPGTGSIRT